MSNIPTYEDLIQRIKELESYLNKSEKTTRLLINLPIAAILLLDENGSIVDCNDTMIQRFKKSRKEIIGASVWDLLPPEVADLRQSYFRKAINNYETIRWEDRRGEFWFDNLFMPIKDTNDKIVQVIACGIDITDRKRIEQELRESDKKYRNLAENPFVGIFRTALDNGTFLYSNQKNAQIIGYDSAQDLIGKIRAADFYPLDARKKMIDTLRRNGKVEDFETELVLGVGKKKNISISAQLWAEKGYLEGVIVDITARKQSEEDLQQSEEQFRQFFEHLTIGVSVFEAMDNGEDFKFIDMNTAGQQLNKVSIDEIRGKRVTQVFPGVRDSGLFKALQDTWRTGKPCHIPFREYKDERITQWVENRVFRLPSRKIVAVSEDRTELMRLQEGLHQAQKMEAISTLAGGIAHDFNNMLCVLTGNVSFALSTLSKDDALFKVLSDALEGTKLAQNLTQQLLTFAKGGEPIKKPDNINKLLEESAKFVTSGAKSRCEFKLTNDLWMAEVDSGQFNQLISNIVINADQAMPNGGIITIRSENIKIGINNNFQLPNGPYIKITIEDQGIGIHEKHIPNIFDPYFTTKQKGSGLGLATAYSIAKRHDGKITVYSELAKGTVFHIYLPASSERVTDAANKKQNRHYGQGRILIMDDQEFILDVLKTMLQSMGYETATASDGAKAIEKFRNAYQSQEPFDLVILDLTVPGGMGGARTIPELIKIDPKVKAIVSSGYSNDPIMANYQDYGFCEVMPKPYTAEHLAELLNKVLG